MSLEVVPVLRGEVVEEVACSNLSPVETFHRVFGWHLEVSLEALQSSHFA